MQDSHEEKVEQYLKNISGTATFFRYLVLIQIVIAGTWILVAILGQM